MSSISSVSSTQVTRTVEASPPPPPRKNDREPAATPPPKAPLPPGQGIRVDQLA